MAIELDIYGKHIEPKQARSQSVNVLEPNDISNLATQSSVNAVSNNLNTNFLKLSGGRITGSLSILGNLSASGELIYSNQRINLFSSQTVKSNQIYNVDTTVGSVTATLPEDANLGDEIEFIDVTGRFGTSPFFIKSNASRFEGLTGNLIRFNSPYESFKLNYVNPSLTGWKIIPIANQINVSFNQGTAMGLLGSFAINKGTANGEFSFANGFNTIAYNSGYAEGRNTISRSAHAEGSNTIAAGLYSHAENQSNIVLGIASHVEGSSNIVGRKVPYESYNSSNKTLTFSPNNSGFLVNVSDNSIIVVNGNGTNVYVEVANRNTTTGVISATESIFVNNINNGYVIVADPSGSSYAHAEGWFTNAIGIASHAAGVNSTAAHNYSYIWSDSNLGVNSSSYASSTTRSGQYAISASGGVFIGGNVGIGTDNNSNPLTVVGNISSTGILYASSINVFDGVLIRSITGNTVWKIRVDDLGSLSTIQV